MTGYAAPALLRPLAVTVGVAVRTSLADRGGLAFTAGFYAAVTLALGALWRTAAGGAPVAGYTAAALTWYVATSEAATISLNARLVDQVGEDVRTGAVAVELLRPVSMLSIRVATELGRSLPRLVVCVVMGLLIAVTTAGGPPSWPALALAVPSLLLAILCNLVAMHAAGAIAFWIRDARSTWFLYQKFVFVIGGMLLPLEVLPAGLEAVGRATPFMAMAYAPARLASGHAEPYLLGVQAFWLVVLAAGAIALYGAGERRLQVVGG
ncbi:MAG TPA: ABC-2 family transporter protein [Frankiaceae bacterium]|nr:ABC-2 family transporter protein [Frankiaceae bacterium]